MGFREKGRGGRGKRDGEEAMRRVVVQTRKERRYGKGRRGKKREIPPCMHSYRGESGVVGLEGSCGPCRENGQESGAGIPDETVVWMGGEGEGSGEGGEGGRVHGLRSRV